MNEQQTNESCREDAIDVARPAPMAPPPPFVRFWYVTEGVEVEGPLPEPQLLERIAAGEVSPEALVCRADDGWWNRIGSIPFFYSVALRGAQVRRPKVPERPVPGLSRIRWPLWPWLLAVVALGVAVVLGGYVVWSAPADYRLPEPFGVLLFGGRLAVALWVCWAMLTSKPAAIGRMIGGALWIVGLGAVAHHANAQLLGVLVLDAVTALLLVVAGWRLSSALAAHERKVRQQAEAYARELAPHHETAWWWIVTAIVAAVGLVLFVALLVLTLVGIALV